MAATCSGVSPLRFLLAGREAAAGELGGEGGGAGGESPLLSAGGGGREEPEGGQLRNPNVISLLTFLLQS